MKELQDPNIELWLCGSGEMEEEIRTYAAQDSRIRFFGFLPHEEAVQLQKQATVLVNPRTNQGEYTKYSFPSKTMEYMASGRPVMMFRLDGIPGEYDPFLTYIPEERAASIRDTVESLRKLSPSELDAMGTRGREFVLKNKNRNVQMCRRTRRCSLTALRSVMSCGSSSPPCRRRSRRGAHTLFLAEVTEARVLSDVPSATYAYYFEHIKPKPQPAAEKKTGFVCKICGYVYEGETLPEDYICPLCKHPASDFVKHEAKPAEKRVGFVCTVCGYVYEGADMPDDFVCPLCHHPKSDFKPLE